MKTNVYNQCYDKSASILLNVFLIIQTFNTVIKENFSSPFFDSYLTILLGILYLFVFMKQIKQIKPAIKSIIVGEILFSLLLLLSILSNYSIKLAIFERCIWTLAFCIPLFCVFLFVNDYNFILQNCRKSVWLITVLSSISIIKYISFNSYQYDMSIGYYLLFPLIVSLVCMRQYRFFVISFFLDLFFILVIGSRGPILCFFVFMVLYLFLAGGNIGRLTIWKVLIIFIFLIALIFYKTILLALNEILSNHGIYSRTITKLLFGTFSNDSGRFDIWLLTLKNIRENWLLGIGVAGELSYMKSYPHQIFLELLLHYGIFLGGYVSIVIIVKTITSFIKTHFKNQLLLVLFCSGFLPLFLSGTYLQSPLAWIFISICINICKKCNFKIILS